MGPLDALHLAVERKYQRDTVFERQPCGGFLVSGRLGKGLKEQGEEPELGPGTEGSVSSDKSHSPGSRPRIFKAGVSGYILQVESQIQRTHRR